MTFIHNGRIKFYAENDTTVYIIRGKNSDILIDTGFIDT